MSRDHCSIELTKVHGLSPEELKGVYDTIEQLKKESDLKGQEFNKVFQKFLQEKEIEIKSQKRNAIEQELKQQRNYAIVDQEHFAEKPEEALQTLLSGTNRKGHEGVGNVQTSSRSLESLAKNQLFNEVKDFKEVEGKVRGADEDFNRQVTQGMNPEKGFDVKTLPAPVQAFVRGMKKSFDFLHKQKNFAGFNVGYVEGYSGRQIHSGERILALGKTVDEAFAKFSEIATRTWDYESMGVKDIAAFNRTMFDEFTTPKDQVISSNANSVLNTSYLKKMQENRTILFKKGAAAFDYFKEVNGTSDYIGHMLRQIRQESTQIALADTFGPLYKVGYENLKARVERNISGKPELQKRLSQYGRKIDDEFKMVSQQWDHSADNYVAKIGKVANGIANVSLLKTAIFTTPTDIVFAGLHQAAMHEQGLFGMAKRLGQTTLDYLNLANPWHEDPKLMAHDVGLFHEDWLRLNNFRYSGGGSEGSGFIHRAYNNMMRWSGLSYEADGMKTANAAFHGGQLAHALESGRNFAELPKNIQDNLLAQGFKESHWNLLQTNKDTAIHKMYNENGTLKRAFVSPEAIMAIDSKSKDVNAAALSYARFLREASDIAVPTPGARETKWKVRWDKNSWDGMLMQSAYQFHSFSISVLNNMTQLGYMGGPKYIASAMISGTVLGAATLALKAPLRGQTLTMPTTAAGAGKLLKDSFFQSGALGPYGDYLQNIWESDSTFGGGIAKMVAGPTLAGPITDAISLLSRTKNQISGEGTRLWGMKTRGGNYGNDTVNIFERNTPGIIFGQAIINRLIYNWLQDRVDPMYNINRQQRQLMRTMKDGYGKKPLF